MVGLAQLTPVFLMVIFQCFQNVAVVSAIGDYIAAGI